MRSKLIYWLIYSGMWLFSALPFRVLYMLSDFNYLLMYRVGKYRRKVVRRNLLRSFPEKTDAERSRIEREFYRYLSDYMLEDLKLLHMSADELCARMTYKNTEQYLELTEKYGGIIVMIPHYANYEWLIGMGAIMKPGDVPVQVYKPLIRSLCVGFASVMLNLLFFSLILSRTFVRAFSKSFMEVWLFAFWKFRMVSSATSFAS